MSKKMIEFNVDYGLNFTSKNLEKEIKKQFKGQEDLIRDYFEKNNGKLDFKINIDNAVDLDGNPIDKKSLDAFTKKYEKAMNATLKTMIDSFKNNLSTEISDAVSESLSSYINKLFSDMTESIVKGIQNMHSDILSALGNTKPMTISQDDIIKVEKTKENSGEKVFSGIVENIVDNVKEETKEAEKSLEQEALEFRLKVQELKKDISDKKKLRKKLKSELKRRENPSDSSSDFNIKIGDETYTKELVSQVQKDKENLKTVLNELYNVYLEKMYAIDDLDDMNLSNSELDSKTKELQAEADNISFIMQQLVSNKREMGKILQVDEEQDTYFSGIFRDIEQSTSDFSNKTKEQLKQLLTETDNIIEDWEKHLVETKKRIDEFSKTSNTSVNVDVNSTKNNDASDKQSVSVNEKGKIISNIQIYPTLNTESFLRKVTKAVEACEAALKEEPVEVPIEASSESIGAFIVDIQDTVSEHPIQIVLDKTNFASQIQESVNGINVDINGNLTGVNISGAQIVNESDYDDDDDGYWEYLEQQREGNLVSAESIASIVAAVESATEETKEFNQGIENVSDNLDKTKEVAEQVRETIKETADVLVGQVEVFNDPEIKILEEKIELYQYLDDLRKKHVSNKKDLTEEENAKRKAIKKEWKDLSPTLEDINSTEQLIFDNEKKIQELENLESKKKLSKIEQERLTILKNEREEIEHNIKRGKESLELSKQKLVIAQQKSSYFNNIHDKTLLQFKKDVDGKHKSKDLRTKALDRVEGIKTKSVGSLEYSDKYKKSKEKISEKKDNKTSTLLEKELEKLVEQDKLWSSINELIKDKGKESALIEINNQTEQLNKQLNQINKQKIAAETDYKRGIYSTAEYEKIKLSLSDQEDDIKKQIQNENKKNNIIKKYDKEQIDQISKNNKQRVLLYKEDLKTQSGITKRVDELRSKDLKSFKQYEYQKLLQEQRIAKKKSYNKQMDEYEAELIKSGVSEKEAKKRRTEVLKGTDYKLNNKEIDRYSTQFTNIELDLEEILKLMKEIDGLQNKLTSENISIEQSEQIKKDLSKKRQDLETIVSRTGWQSADIVKYKDFSEGQKKENSIVKKSINIDNFKKDANTIQDIVNNIQKELEVAEKENKELIDSVSETEKHLKDSKDKITLNYHDIALKVKEALEKLQKEESYLKEEIQKSNNQDDIKAKETRLGEVKAQIKNFKYRNKEFLNQTTLQARIDRDFESANKNTLENIKVKKSQILVNNDYIASLKEIKAEQEELRRVEEPTQDELKSRNKKLTAEKSKNNKHYNKLLQETKDIIADITVEIQEAEKEEQKAIGEIDADISKLNEKLDKAESKLEEIKSRKVDSNIKNQTNTDSELYSEYTEKQGVFTRHQYDQQKIIDDAKSEINIINRELDKISDRNKDAINKQSFNIRQLKEKIEIEESKDKDKIDRDNLNTLKEQLEVEKKKKAEMESQYNLASELEKRQQIILAADRIKTKESIAKKGNIDAQKDLIKDIQLIERLSKETGVHIGEVVKRIDRKGQEFTTMSFNMDRLYDMSSDIEKYAQLQDKKAKDEQIVRKTKLPDSNIYRNTKKEYSEKIKSAFVEEQRLYNEELQKSQDYIRETGDLTEEAENHLLNMYRYMQEYVQVAGAKRSELFTTFNIDKDTEKRMKLAWTDAKSVVSNISDASISIEREISEQQKIIDSLKEQIRFKKNSKNIEKQKVDELKRQLSYHQEELKRLEAEKKAKNEILDLEQKENKQKITEISKPKEEVISSNVVDSSIENEKDKIVELKNTDEQVTNSQISNQNEVQNEVNQTTEDIKEVTDALQEQKKEATTTSTANISSPIKEMQQEAQEEIAKTDQMLQQQISNAIQAAHISIAEGSSVNIAGSVKIDDGQFGSLSGDLTEVQDIAYELLDVVRKIYKTISGETGNAIKNIQSAETPISDITLEANEAGEAIEEVQVQLSKTSKKLEVISGGNIDLKGGQFKAVKHAVDAMNKAASSNSAIRKIKESGDITAKYFTRQEEIEDEKGNIKNVTKEYVALNSVFKDTNGQIIKLQHIYDVAENKITDFGNASAKIADNFTRQNKAIKSADVQMNSHLNKLDKLKIKYETFDIGNFGIDENGNLFAKVGTDAEQTFNIITGKTKELVKNVILQMKNVEDKFESFRTKASKGVLSQNEFETLSKDFSVSIEKLENSMNAVNRRITTQLEHTSRSWLNSWQRELSNAEAFVWNIDGTERIDKSNYNAQGVKYIEQYKDALLDLQEMYRVLHEQGEYFTQDQVNNWKRQIQTISDLKKKINSNSAKPYVNGLGSSLDGISLDETQFKKLTNDSTYARNSLMALAKEITGVDVEFIKLAKDNQTLTYSFKDIDKNIQTCKLSVSDYGKTIRNTTVTSQKHVGLLSRAFGTLKDKILQIMKYVSAYEIFYKVVNAIRNGVEIVKELDSAMTEMKKVTHDTQKALDDFAKTSHKMAQEIGSTASTIQNSAADWMRLGYSIKEAAGLAKNTSILMNVSEFEDIETATESMVAMIQAFKGEGTDVIKLSEELIDKLNNIGNNYSISTSELAESLKRSSGTLIAANNSVDEAIALTTAGNALIQDAETTGSALKVISMRIRGTSVEELEGLGEDSEGLIETTSKLEAKVKSLTAVNGKMGVSLTDANGNYRSTYEILQDIADLWGDIGKADIADGQNRQAALLEALAGKTRSQSLASILQNAEMLRSVYEDVQNSEGSAAEENEAYMESIEAHLEVLKAKWQELWDNTLGREEINWVIDRLCDLLDLVNSVGLKFSALFAGGALFGLFKALKGENSGGRDKKFSLVIKYATESFNREVCEF